MFPIVVVHHELNNDDDGWGFENLWKNATNYFQIISFGLG